MQNQQFFGRGNAAGWCTKAEVNVDQGQIGRLLTNGFQSLHIRPGNGRYVVTGFVERFAQVHRRNGFVFDNQNLQ